MRVFQEIESVDLSRPSAVTVGSFDGLHRGHLKIIDQLLSEAQRRQLASVLVTFDPHPQKVLAIKTNPIQLLTSTEEKLDLLDKIGIEYVVVIPFDWEFAALAPQEFVSGILIDKLKMSAMIVGFNHHFGKNRAAGYPELKLLGEQLGFSTSKVGPLVQDEDVISSTAIRHFLLNGQIESANDYLGRRYSLSGMVVHGDGRGRKIGFPTANIEPKNSDKLRPAAGVYAVDVKLSDGQVFKGMMNIGVRPTFDIDTLTLEVHLFSFKADLYGQNLEIIFKKFVRQEKKFSGIEALRSQLLKDQEICKNI